MELLAIYLMSLLDWLQKADRALFTLIHAKASGPGLDWLMLALRNAYTWIPLYGFILWWIIRYYRRYAWPFVCMSLVCFAITDYSSASIFKPLFGRLRPCFDPVLQPVIRDLVGCGGKFGMPSSHASNHFGLASFWFFSITWMSKRNWWGLWLWAFAICYAQVYVGKHFPGDILVGAILGTSVGLLLAVLLRRWLLATVHRKTA